MSSKYKAVKLEAEMKGISLCWDSGDVFGFLFFTFSAQFQAVESQLFSLCVHDQLWWCLLWSFRTNMDLPWTE